MNQPVTPGGPPPPEFQTPAPPPDGASRGLLIAILSALGVILIGGLVTGAFLMGRSSDPDKDLGDDVAANATTSSSSSSTTVAPTTAAPATQAPPATAAPGPRGVGDVLEQPAGLFCRDLRAIGYSYSAAVDYWRQHGQPDRMDADLDGVPCETVYPVANIDGYWGEYGIVPTYDYYPVFDLPGGLFCRDLADAGYDTYDALSYYLMWGLPSNMDADGDTIPCETVYPDAEWVWFNAAF